MDEKKKVDWIRMLTLVTTLIKRNWPKDSDKVNKTLNEIKAFLEEYKEPSESLEAEFTIIEALHESGEDLTEEEPKGRGLAGKVTPPKEGGHVERAMKSKNLKPEK